MRAARDIFLLFLFCVLLITAVRFPGNAGRTNYDNWYTFDTSFFTGHSLLSAALPPQRGKKEEQVYERRFRWQDHNKVERETLFRLRKSFVKKETRRFGTSRAMTNPFFMEKKGFKVVGRRNVYYNNKFHEQLARIIDYKKIFDRNLEYVEPLTLELIKSAELAPRKDPIFAFLKFAQYIPYKLPPKWYKGRFINSFFVPLVMLYEGYGDCDSKSILLADLLCTTPVALAHARAGKPGEKTAMVLVRGKGLAHAVLAVKRSALPGMTSINYMKKGNYILLETTDTRLAPGFIHPRVTDVLKAGMFEFIELN